MSLRSDATPSPELPMPRPDSANVSVTPEPEQQRYTFAGSPRPGAPYAVQDLLAPNIRTLNFRIVKYVIDIHTMYIKDYLVVWYLSLTIVWCSNPKSKRNTKKLRIRETKNLSTDADSRTDTILERLHDKMKKNK